LRDLPCKLTLHETPVDAPLAIGPLRVTADFVAHPDATMGFRIQENSTSIAYLPDHEPALGEEQIPQDIRWLSGHRLAEGADLLIHDSQYLPEEYPEHVGWGHSAITHTLAFAEATGVKRLVTFHHDPNHSDALLDKLHEQLRANCNLPYQLIPGQEGGSLQFAH
jgi:ribonuclease BN (tRNA processing enzyme)